MQCSVVTVAFLQYFSIVFAIARCASLAWEKQDSMYAGCFLQSGRFSRHNNTESVTKSEGFVLSECTNFCNNRMAMYTYAGLAEGKVCYCFDDIRLLKATNAEHCEKSCAGLHEDAPCSGRFTVEVQRTCPQHTFAPPYCTGYCPAFCRSGVCLANGTCEYGCDQCYSSQETQVLSSIQTTSGINSASLYKELHEPKIAVYTSWGTAAVDGFVQKISYFGRPGGVFYLSFWEVSMNTKDVNRTFSITLQDKIKLTSEFPAFTSVHPNSSNVYLQIYKGYTLGVHFGEKLAHHFDYNVTAMLARTGLYASHEASDGADVNYITEDMPYSYDPDDGLDNQGWTSGHTLPNSEDKRLFVEMEKPQTSLITVHIHSKCPVTCNKEVCTKDMKCAYGCQPGFMGPNCQTPCPAKKFGPNCDFWCSPNCKEELCDHRSGMCMSGCVAGVTGPFCDMPCQTGTFGESCEQKCSSNCSISFYCRAKDGACFGGCKAGFKPPSCVDMCDNKKFGINCSVHCGHCQEESPCNIFTGECPGKCETGYMPPICKCPRNYYGLNCSSVCENCAGNVPCTRDGICEFGCKFGLQPPFCACPFGKFGSQCEKSCTNCKGKVCHNLLGKCLHGCVSGYSGSHCNQTCEPGYFGENCRFVCGHCEGGVLNCNKTTGFCSEGCLKGLKRPLCDTCELGYYGDRCQFVCGECSQGVSCNHNGYCLNGCKEGLEPPMCVCPFRKFGTECKHDCGFCKGHTGCLSNGTCLDGCMAGYGGALCTDTCPLGYYGDGCKTPCSTHCKNQLCHYESGKCLEGCESGYARPNCECLIGYFKHSDECIECGRCSDQCSEDGTCPTTCQEDYKLPTCHCKVGFYSSNCSAKCGHCKGGRDCDSMTGKCADGCKVGYLPPMCDEPCPDARYGVNCSGICGRCTGDVHCDKITGHCPDGCYDGYQDSDFCKEQCPNNFYGPDCKHACHNCRNGSGCHFITGECIAGCEIGYLPPNCAKPCPPGQFGYNCEDACGRCNDTTCSPDTGECLSGCETDFRPPMCLTPINITTADSSVHSLVNNCPMGQFGSTCTNLCGKCVSGKCDSRGVCIRLEFQETSCTSGFKPPLCVYPCDAGFYGNDCLSKCGHCYETRQCDLITGFCPFGCIEGYVEPYCSLDHTARRLYRKLPKSLSSASTLLDCFGRSPHGLVIFYLLFYVLMCDNISSIV